MRLFNNGVMAMVTFCFQSGVKQSNHLDVESLHALKEEGVRKGSAIDLVGKLRTLLGHADWFKSARQLLEAHTGALHLHSQHPSR